ncbi:ABC transporter substrate-binding protein [Pseudomonas typographi]|uniref:Twin-arginine translocation signal domain-containing protein n=1 Tax=Pseudomonas typographi TaxID=2715964 RepID=A0ABR7YWY2_9PSED|nr:ABC transporter substrate-binding protein [Pseudomonas typographi]MBD1551271.1 twin-arginine translocation signal domain-containing protein [Pseudomonas typographi]MBD1597707.1 twin-arginine translocation signal domain-containing protein [Pseudomonas typographi]
MSADTYNLERRQFLRLLGVGAGAATLAGFLPSALADEVAGQASGQAIVKGGTLFANVTPEPAGLVAGINISSPAVVISSSIFDGLVTYDAQFRPQPQLAESWEEAADGKRITFHLRKGVKWHDGTPFTSADVQYSILNVVKKTHPRGASNLAKVTDVQIPDEHTVVFILSGPAPVLWATLFGTETQIVPKHLYEGTNPLTNPWNSKPVGTGAFKFKEWVRGSHVTLERNPDYWDAGKPYLDRIIFKMIPDAGARAVALESGEIQFAANNPVPESEVARLQQNPALQLDTTGWQVPAPMFFFDFNLRRKTFQDLRVRKAFAHAIDRQGLADIVWYGLADVAQSCVPSFQQQFFKPGLPQYDFDPKKAEQLLDEAGYPRGADGVRLRINHVTEVSYGQVYLRAAEYMRQQLKNIGVEMELINLELAAMIRRLFTDYDFDTVSQWYSAYPDPQIGVTRRFWSKNIKPGTPSSNNSGYSNPEMDRIIEGIQEEGDVAKRKLLIDQMQELVQTDVPSVNLLELKFFGFYSSKLQGLRKGPLLFYSSLADAWLEP